MSRQRNAAEPNGRAVADDAIYMDGREGAAPPTAVFSTGASPALAISRAPEAYFNSAKPPQ